MDKTRLFFKMVPRKTCLSPWEDTATTLGAKGMSNKGLVTVLGCTNSDGLLKVAGEIMGDSDKFRCFRSEKPSLYYVLQEKA